MAHRSRSEREAINPTAGMRGKYFVMAAIITSFVLILLLSKLGTNVLCHVPKGYLITSVAEVAKDTVTCVHDDHLMTINIRRRLAATVAEVQQEIHRLAGKKTFVDSKWSSKLAAVVEELDPRMTFSIKPSWDYSALLPNMNSAEKIINGPRHVCPEVYTKVKSKYGQSGMASLECTGIPAFSSVLTAVLPAITWSPESVNFVTKQIRNHYDIPIIVVVLSEDNIDKNLTSITIEKVSEEASKDEGSFMNNLLERVKTPYVLIATALAHFNNQSSLERLVRVLDELEHVKVAGGAARDLEGHWIHGCLQQHMANYEAHYTSGYFYSKYECMYCDDLLTPFITSPALIHQVPFADGLNGSALYRDWFANLRLTGSLTMSCPDVMFYVSNHPIMEKEQWLTIAKKWELEKITSYNNQEYSFNCSSIGVTCKNSLKIIKSYLLPPCCKAQMTKYLGYLTKYGETHNLSYELQAGSAIGAMKMGSYLPWDFDHDLIFMCKDFDAWMKVNQVLNSTGCRATVTKKNKYITVYCRNFFLELYCYDYNATSQQFLPPEYKYKPTRIKYSGEDVVVSANPGLHSRNRYGFDILKHVGHWRTVKVSSSRKKENVYDYPAFWNPCKLPRHHSCLDHYPIDGNLPFTEPFLRL